MHQNINKKINKLNVKLLESGLNEKKINGLNNEIAKLQNKYVALNEVITEIDVLRKSTQMYNIKRDNSLNVNGDIIGFGAETRSGSRYNFETDEFDIILGDNSTGLLAHELKHAFQFETGELSSGINPQGLPFYDKADEIEAYKREALIRETTPQKLLSLYDQFQTGPQSINTLDPSIRNNQDALRRYAQQLKCAFRFRGVTYRFKNYQK